MRIMASIKYKNKFFIVHAFMPTFRAMEVPMKNKAFLLAF